METLFWFFFLMQVKHYIVDFPLQDAYQYKNKGNWRHPGGYVHALGHGAITILVLLCITSLTFPTMLAIAGLEIAAHYIIDWSKVNITKHMNWGMTTHEQFWWLLGFDQLLHQLCYIGIATWIFL